MCKLQAVSLWLDCSTEMLVQGKCTKGVVCVALVCHVAGFFVTAAAAVAAADVPRPGVRCAGCV